MISREAMDGAAGGRVAGGDIHSLPRGDAARELSVTAS